MLARLHWVRSDGGSCLQVSGTAGEASHPEPHAAVLHRKSASAAVALGGGFGTGARRSIGGRSDGPQLHSIDSGASDELGGPEPTLGGALPGTGSHGAGGGVDNGNSTAAELSKPGDTAAT